MYRGSEPRRLRCDPVSAQRKLTFFEIVPNLDDIAATRKTTSAS